MTSPLLLILTVFLGAEIGGKSAEGRTVAHISKNWGSDFNCHLEAPSNFVPTSVQHVKPADIKVVGAVGDSITAGFGAKATDLSNVRTEYRGVSWSIGGDGTLETVTTLPNILKKYNPNLKGVSLGTGSTNTGYNMAISGATMSNIPEQVQSLIDTMKADQTVIFQTDWKLVTIFAGTGDLCRYCKDPDTYSSENYRKNLKMSLDLLYEEVPRVIVNVAEVLDMLQPRKVRRNNPGCNLIPKSLCPCFEDPEDGSPELEKMIQVNLDFQEKAKSVLADERYKQKEDFAANLMSLFKKSRVPLKDNGEADLSFLSPDCFHLSERGHAQMALALWQEMINPSEFNPSQTNRRSITCATNKHRYISTWANRGGNEEPDS